MTRLGRFVMLPLLGLLALALVAITVAQSDSGPVAEVRVWQKIDDPLNIHVSARATGGRWETLGTIRLRLDDGVSPDGRYRYGDFTVPAAEVIEDEDEDEDEDDEAARDGVVSGRVYFGGGEVELPEGAVVTVRLLDISLADAASVTLGEQVIRGAQGLPLQFRVAYDEEDIDEHNDYSLQATVRHQGRLLYINDTVHTVLSRGYPEDSNIEVIRVAPVAEAVDDEVLTLLYWQAPSLPGPYLSGGLKDQDAGAVTLEPLAHHAPDGELVPALAEEIPTVENGGVSSDRLTITWKLKDGLKWSDGSDMTAEDVVFTWRYCSDEATGCTAEDLFAGIESMEALDPRTVKITFSDLTPYPYDAFVGAGAPIISAAQFADCVGAAASACEEENTHPLGTGPYRIVSFKAEQGVVYERNPHYRGEKPYFDRVVLKGGGDAVAAARAVLVAGDADYGWNLQVEADVLAELEAGDEGTIVLAFSDLVERIVLNQTNPDPALGDDRSEYLDGENPHPFLSFRPIRQAMSMAIDRERVAALYGFAGKPECDLVAGPPHYVSGANDACRTQDIAGAKRLLDEQGVLDSDGDGVREYDGVPLRITFVTSTNALRLATQALVQDWWREIGIETQLIDHDAGVYFGNTPGAESYRRFFADVQMYATGGGPEPQSYLSDQRCSHIPMRANNWAEGNVARSCNPEFDAAFEELPPLPLGPEREVVVQRLNDILVQSYVEIPLVSRGLVSGHANTLKGIRFNAWDSELWNIAEWHR